MSVKRPATVLVVAAVIACAAAPALGGSHSRSAHAAAQSDAKARILRGLCRLSRAQQQQLLARFGAALRRHLPHLRTAAASVPAADRDAILARLRANA